MKLTKEYIDRLEDYKRALEQLSPFTIEQQGAINRLFGYLEALKVLEVESQNKENP